MKSAILTGFALALGGLALSACDSGGGEPAVQASPDGFPGIEISNARLVLPAVAGNPAAAYFDIGYQGDQTAMIRAASVAGATTTTMHSTTEHENGTTSMDELLQVPIPNGETLKFEPGGRHLMAMGLPETLKAGDKVEVTLTFLGGDKTSFEAEVRAPGEPG